MQVNVPSLGESISTAIVARWLKAPGDVVHKDEPVLELETDKVSMEVPAPISGVLKDRKVSEGDEVSVGETVCTISGETAVSAQSPTQDTDHKTASRDNPEEFDLVVIGAGPGGYSCAIRAAQLGMKVACIEKKALGGTCLNVGCIPSKALLQATENYHALRHEFFSQGIEVDPAHIDVNLEKMQQRKQDIVAGNVKGIGYLLKKNGITLYEGEGRVVSPHRVAVNGEHVSAKNIVIATGSKSTHLAGVEIDEKHIVTSTGALDFTEIPKKFAVIGGGVIGVELGSVYKRLGAKVTIIEFLPHLLGNMDRGIEKAFRKEMTRQGFVIKTQEKVTSCSLKDGGVSVETQSLKNEELHKEQFDKVLVAVGRGPQSNHCGLDEVGVKRDRRGFVEIDDHFSTNIDGIYAIGDVVGGPMLAHKASEEGVALAEIHAGQLPCIDYDAIPSVVYTSPEVASVGLTEQQLSERDIPYHVGQFPFKANGRARTMDQTEGFVKIFAQPHSDRVLGVHIFGPCAGELIAEATMALEFGASSEDIARICHAHPTLSEVVREAAMDVSGTAINM